jgi:hypothetical protein
MVRWLAPRLAEQLQLPEAERYTQLNDVVCAYLATSKSDRRKIYNGLRAIFEKHTFTSPQPLLQLAEITDFDLFISTTFDPLLTLAMEQHRPGFARSRDVLRFDTKPSTRPFPYPVQDSLVYHILGDLECFPDFCVWEEDYMEYLCCLIAQRHDASMEGLFKLLADRHLLLGAPYSDWVVHFFLRAARGSRLTGVRKDDATEIIADSTAVLGRSTIFFNNTVHAASLIDIPPADFVAELSRRWHAERDVSAQDFLQRMGKTMPKGAVFLSYSRDDLTAAQRLAMTLKTANIPIWMDTDRLQAGDFF